MKNIFKSIFGVFSRMEAKPAEVQPPQPPKRDDDGREKSAAKRLKESRDASARLMDALAGQKRDDFNREVAIQSIFPRQMSDFIGKSAETVDTHRTIAMDGAVATGKPAGNKSGAGPRSSSAGTGVNRNLMNDTVLRHFQNRGFIGWQTCAILAQHEIINRACSIPAEDAIAHGYKIVCSSMKHDQTAEHDADEARWLYELKKYSDRMGMNDICIQLEYKKKVFGVGLAIPRIDGADYEKPFNIDGIKKGSYHGFAVVDPYWLTYEFDDSSQSDPTSVSFYDPTWYRMPNGKRVHKSWIIRCVNAHVPDILKPTYYFGGVPLPQMIYERVFCADKIANEAPLLAMTKRLLIADANVEELYKDPAHASKMMKAINYFRDNFSIFFKKPSSQVQQIDTSLGEFDQLIMTQYQLVACIAQMPATKLLKVTPTGFQSTGEYEWKDYAQALLDIQNNDYDPLLEFHYQLLIKSLYPERDDLAVEVTFNPIDVPTKDANATVEARIAQFLSTLINSGVITPDEARKVFRLEDGGMLTFLDPEMPEILQKMFDAKDPDKQAQMQGGMPGGGMPGMPPVPPGGQGQPDLPGAGQPQGGGEEQPDTSGQEYSEAFTQAVKHAEELVYGKGNSTIEKSGAEQGDAGSDGQGEESQQDGSQGHGAESDEQENA